MTPAQFKRARKMLGLSQPELAELLDIASDRTLRRWEADQLDIPGPVALVMELIMEIPEVREYLDLNYVDGSKKENHGGHYDD
jgi:DNA-binding transcriptional regulator YiaG